jgi:hypothetical protein
MEISTVGKSLARVLALSALAMAPALAQPSDTPNRPQTARQALMEMFFSKTPGTFVKHLPAATVSALEKSGALATLQQYSALAGQFQTKGKTFETFETGSVMLAAEDLQSGQKFEMTVENDALQGDEDDVEVSFQTYKEKQLQRTPYMPRMTFVMKMEADGWKLNEIRLTIRLPLADPDFLKSITEGMKARTAAASSPTQPQVQMSTTTFGADVSVLAAMRTILTAEATYNSTYGRVGYTCTLSDLDGFGGGEPNEHQAMLIASGLASGKKYGYVFALSGCAGTPATGFHLVATPAPAGYGGSSFGRRAFCSDQSGAIRSSADGNPATCLASGVPAQ